MALPRKSNGWSTYGNAPRVLRVSVTDRCNLRCRYCRPPPASRHRALSGSGKRLPSLGELIDTVVWLQRELELRKIKLTGGEPLQQSGLADAVERLRQMTTLDDLSLTTNGSQLKDLAVKLRQAGLDRVNVSLDTLDPVRFRYLTGGRLRDTLEGIEAACAAGLRPVKLNAVLRRSTWTEDVPQLLDHAAALGLEVRFIELMRTGTAAEWA